MRGRALKSTRTSHNDESAGYIRGAMVLKYYPNEPMQDAIPCTDAPPPGYLSPLRQSRFLPRCLSDDGGRSAGGWGGEGIGCYRLIPPPNQGHPPSPSPRADMTHLSLHSPKPAKYFTAATSGWASTTQHATRAELVAGHSKSFQAAMRERRWMDKVEGCSRSPVLSSSFAPIHTPEMQSFLSDDRLDAGMAKRGETWRSGSVFLGACAYSLRGGYARGRGFVKHF
jgi:hypothetical protein